MTEEQSKPRPLGHTHDIKLSYDHTSGKIKVHLPSGTVVGFTKHQAEGLFTFLTKWAMLPQPARKIPLTREEVYRLSQAYDGPVTKKPEKIDASLSLADLGL